MRQVNKVTRFLQHFALVSALCFVAGCGSQSDSDTTDTAEKSTDSTTTPTTTSTTNTPTANPLSEADLCKTATADPDGDGWGWEDHNPCVADTSLSTVADDGNDLPIGILYFLWHCQATSLSTQHNISEVLNGQSDWGGQGRFHWWDKPAEGYYCLGDRPDLIERHLIMLRDAGIDFLVLDITNHPNTVSFDAETFIFKSLLPLLKAAKSLPGAPKIVPWVPLTEDNPGTTNERNSICDANPNSGNCQALQQSSPMYQHVTDLLTNEYPELMFEYNGKPLLLEAAADARYPREQTDQVRPTLETNWHVERMWGLRLHNEMWQFLSTCKNRLTSMRPTAGLTQVAINPSTQEHRYLSRPPTSTRIFQNPL